MSSQKAPAAPDYTPIANASKEAAAEAAALSREQFEWAKQAYAENKGVTDRVVESFLSTQDRNDKNAIADRKRYEDIYQPLEDSLAKEATDFASPERRALEMGRAGATVAQKFEAERANATRNLESFGIDPTSTRYAALDLGLRAQKAASQAGAENQAGQMVDATGRALRSEAINVGRGYPGQIAGTTNTALQSGTGAINGNLATTASGGQTMGTAPQWSAVSNGALGTAANALNTGYSNSLAQFKANQEASSGAGSALGLIAGLGSKFLFAADGGEVDGGGVPEQLSPTRGRAIDDVPARLTAGEFIVPKDTVEWLGQKHFYGLIEKSAQQREEAKQKTGAIPQVKRIPGSSAQRPSQAIDMKRAA